MSSFSGCNKKIYVIRSTYDYEIDVDCENDRISSKMYDQAFFNDNIVVRDTKSGLFSYLNPSITFFSEKKLEMELLPPFFHNLPWKEHSILPGRFNVGQHFRPLECPVHLFHSDTIKINNKDPLYYVRFFTDEKIVFKRFFVTTKLFKITNNLMKKRTFTKKIIPLQWYYDNTYKKTILKEIQNNLLE